MKRKGANRVAKCHGYDGYIRVKILADWGKNLGEHAIQQNQPFFWGRFVKCMKDLWV